MATIKTLLKADLKRLPEGNAIIAKITRVRGEKYSGGSSVTVYGKDMTPAEVSILHDVVEKYVYGEFNGMDDSYSYKKREDTEMSFKYGFVNNEQSDEMRQKIINFLKETYQVTDDESAQRQLCRWYSEAINRTFYGNVTGFWK